jgi:hypothetical protein
MRLLGGGPRRWQSTMRTLAWESRNNRCFFPTHFRGSASPPATHPLEHRSLWVPALSWFLRPERKRAGDWQRTCPAYSGNPHQGTSKFDCMSTSCFEMDVSTKRLNSIDERCILHSHMNSVYPIRIASSMRQDSCSGIFFVTSSHLPN